MYGGVGGRGREAPPTRFKKIILFLDFIIVDCKDLTPLILRLLFNKQMLDFIAEIKKNK
jgi:hypothetical protein